MNSQTHVTTTPKIIRNAAREQSESTSLSRARIPISSSKGTTSSNTVPSNCNNQYRTKILRHGIDSLYLSYQGELSLEGSTVLAKLKKLAQSDDPRKVAQAQYCVGEHIFEVSDKGSNPFAYVLKDNWFRISIAKLGNTQTPLAYVQVSSHLLTSKSVDRATNVLSSIINSLSSPSDTPNVSRVDLCVDFITDYPLDTITDIEWVTKAKEMHRHVIQRYFSGWSIGSRKKMSARLYDKTLEMKKNPRPYLERLWKDAGWDGIQPVWRLEFELRRDLLREFSVVSIDDLNGHLAGLWEYSTYDWLRLAIPNPKDKTQSRWLTTNLWTTLQSVQWSGVLKLSRTLAEKGRLPSDRSLFVNGISAYTSFMAREGITDPEEGMTAFFQAATYYHDTHSLITGVPFKAYVKKKVDLKKRLFNSGYNNPTDHPIDNVVSDEYRKHSNG